MLTDHNQKTLSQDVLSITANQLQSKLQLEEYLAQDGLYQRHIHKTNVKQSHGLNMTPMSID